jgi:hypothetical protein
MVAVGESITSMISGLDWDRVVVGIEDVVAPSMRDEHGHRKPFDPEPLIGTAFLAGALFSAVAGFASAAYMIPPGGNGHGPYMTYPEDLVSAQERQPGWEMRVAGGGALRHARAAYDVMKRAEQLDRPHRRQG